jgi:predicted signal transduction protein with EAL and GGDEF domain
MPVRLDELLRQADTAMYAAKAAGKGTVRQYGQDLDIHPSESTVIG